MTPRGPRGRAHLSLDARQARALHLEAQGLFAPSRRRARREDLRDAIARMELLQIDTIHVVARSPYLVLFSRLGAYDPRWLDVFGFDYRLECYVPAAKRRYGYYVLPILRRGELVGRLDAKAHRSEGVFEVKALYLEPAVRTTGALLRDIAGAIASCAAWHGTPEVRLRRMVPGEARASLGAELRDARESVRLRSVPPASPRLRGGGRPPARHCGVPAHRGPARSVAFAW